MVGMVTTFHPIVNDQLRIKLDVQDMSKSKAKSKNPEDFQMTLGEHLEELRSRIIWGFIGPVIAAIGTLIYGKQLVGIICMPVLTVMNELGLPPQLYNTNVTSAFMVYLKVSLIGGLIIGLPWLLYQMWKFVELGLYQHERKFVYLLVPGSTILTFSGLLFMYFIMLPVTLWFLLSFAVNFPLPTVDSSYFPTVGLAAKATGLTDPDELGSEDPQAAPVFPTLPVLVEDPDPPVAGQSYFKVPENEIRIYANGKVRAIDTRVPQDDSLMKPIIQIDEYISFVMWLGLAFALCFQLPLVMWLLAMVGIVKHAQMKLVRKYALLAGFVAGALLTPADPLSQTMLAVPIYLLYELGLFVTKFIKPRQPSEDSDEEGWAGSFLEGDDDHNYDDQPMDQKHVEDTYSYDDPGDYDYQHGHYDNYHDHYHDYSHYHGGDHYSNDGYDAEDPTLSDADKAKAQRRKRRHGSQKRRVLSKHLNIKRKGDRSEPPIPDHVDHRPGSQKPHIDSQHQSIKRHGTKKKRYTKNRSKGRQKSMPQIPSIW